MRCVITLVLPLPGPASTSSGPSMVVTAWRCGSFSPASRSMGPDSDVVMRSILKEWREMLLAGVCSILFSKRGEYGIG